MMDRYPRTVGEFIEHSRMVIIECEACRRKAPIDLSVLELTFGADFDMYSSMRSMRDQLGCPACGHPRPVISFYNPNAPHFAEVSFEDSVTSQLEFSAYNRARQVSNG
jgi:hypothetical protein